MITPHTLSFRLFTAKVFDVQIFRLYLPMKPPPKPSMAGSWSTSMGCGSATGSASMVSDLSCIWCKEMSGRGLLYKEASNWASRSSSRSSNPTSPEVE